ncbi:uncharacterized protein MELLADRAFT_104444 [Melampsora larici-populina 98AG31]|uniref:FAR1 domain-containing protein n=1 Tax=Melampsora larici-populina (strain 98AG31 / pathotype 3-4-7) TaxID=747676 RepID=F4REQ2_MELLP|nr:uncharacterized protein MELLADRAFT_104444 [Melampsora larici-populina 98AG31]EGG09140.1 hypothetical protein MELLADRAFT_104444 [Melampsora larici-populina 98AG31]
MTPFEIHNTIPAPPPITLPGPTLELMNKYVKEFSPQHGYLISIGRSSVKKKPNCRYRCHRSGLPEAVKDSTKELKSLKIDCPFLLKARYNSVKQSWTLTHVNTTHNHPPNPDIQLQYTPAQAFNPPVNATIPIPQPSTSSHKDHDDATLVLGTLGQADTQPTLHLNSPTRVTSTSNPHIPHTSEPMVDLFVSMFRPRLLALSVDQQKKLSIKSIIYFSTFTMIPPDGHQSEPSEDTPHPETSTNKQVDHATLVIDQSSNETHAVSQLTTNTIDGQTTNTIDEQPINTIDDQPTNTFDGPKANSKPKPTAKTKSVPRKRVRAGEGQQELITARRSLRSKKV